MTNLNYLYFVLLLSLIYTLPISSFYTSNGDYLSKHHLSTELLNQTKQGDLFAVSQLLEQDADPNSTYNYNNSILGIALFCKHYVIAELLLRLGADPNAQNVFGSAPLYAAVAQTDKTAVQLLLRYNADPNIGDRLGNTPLHSAVYRGQPKIVQLLLNHGANPYIQNIQGQTAKTIAESQYLINYQARTMLQKLLCTIEPKNNH